MSNHQDKNRLTGRLAAAAAVVLALAGAGMGSALAAPGDAASAPDAASVSYAAGSQYTVRPGQSLNDVAIAVTQSHDRATLARATHALFDANPNAFMSHDPSRMRVGAVLTIPALDASGALAASSAASSAATSPAGQAAAGASAPGTAAATDAASGVQANAAAASAASPASSAAHSAAPAAPVVSQVASAPAEASAAPAGAAVGGAVSSAPVAGSQAAASSSASGGREWSGAIQPTASEPAAVARPQGPATAGAQPASQPRAQVSSLQQLLALKNRVLMELQKHGIGGAPVATSGTASAGASAPVAAASSPGPAETAHASAAAVPAPNSPGMSQTGLSVAAAVGAALVVLLAALRMLRRKREAGAAAEAASADGRLASPSASDHESSDRAPGQTLASRAARADDGESAGEAAALAGAGRAAADEPAAERAADEGAVAEREAAERAAAQHVVGQAVVEQAAAEQAVAEQAAAERAAAERAAAEQAAAEQAAAEQAAAERAADESAVAEREAAERAAAQRVAEQAAAEQAATEQAATERAATERAATERAAAGQAAAEETSPQQTAPERAPAEQAATGRAAAAQSAADRTAVETAAQQAMAEPAAGHEPRADIFAQDQARPAQNEQIPPASPVDAELAHPPANVPQPAESASSSEPFPATHQEMNNGATTAASLAAAAELGAEALPLEPLEPVDETLQQDDPARHRQWNDEPARSAPSAQQEPTTDTHEHPDTPVPVINFGQQNTESRMAPPLPQPSDDALPSTFPEPSMPAQPASAAPSAFPRDAVDAFSSLDMPLPPRIDSPADAEHAATSRATQPAASPQDTAQHPIASQQPDDTPHIADEIAAGTAGHAALAGLGARGFGSLNLDFDLELPPSPAPPLPAFTQTDLIRIARNKLDLASEYIELGDLSGARTLINEVIEADDPATRTEARALLSTLAPLS